MVNQTLITRQSIVLTNLNLSIPDSPIAEPSLRPSGRRAKVPSALQWGDVEALQKHPAL